MFPGTLPIGFYSTFTPAPTSNTVLLLHMDGVEGSTTFTDVGGKTVTRVGNPVISTSQFKFGGASGYFNGSSYLTLPLSNTDFQFGSGDLTWEVWVRPSRVNQNYEAILSNSRGATSGNAGLLLSLHQGKFVLRHWVNGSTNAVSTQTISANTWYHVVGIKTGTTLKVFVDGIIGSNGSTTVSNTDNQFTIGTAQVNGGFATTYLGHLDEIRIMKGIALYSDNFTPPTSPF